MAEDKKITTDQQTTEEGKKEQQLANPKETQQEIYFADSEREDNTLEKGLAWFASASLWALFLYLLQFFLTAVFLAFTSIFLYNNLFASEAASGTWELLKLTVIVSFIAFLVLFLWATWNKFMYGGLDRRKPRPMPSDEEIAELYGQTTQSLAMAREAKCLTVLYKAELRFDIRPLPIAASLQQKGIGGSADEQS